MVILVKYGTDHAVESRKIAWAKESDTIVLLQDGVFWAKDDRIKEAEAKKIKVFAIKDEYLSRGCLEKDAKVPLISYDKFIEILEKDTKTVG
ncbi:MAG: sulfur relay protein DsrH [Spirochaetes bacterium]|nr:MAG: sulfur relay protein DsrH [Spirochaetota bacterium]